MRLEKVLKEGSSLELPKELLKKARLPGRVNIIIKENEIIIKKALKEIAPFEKMAGLGKGIFNEDSVTLQRRLREEWKP